MTGLNTTGLSLPIDSHLSAILAQLKNRRSLVLKSPPGTGKTLRLPPYLVFSQKGQQKKAVVLVPKRLAAVSAAYRVCEEQNLNLIENVGYQVRFDSKFDRHTPLIYMTEGVFLKRLADSDFINNLDYILLDEFHERNSDADLILAVLNEKIILDDHFKAQLVVMSATLESEELLKYLDGAAEYVIEAPKFPLQLIKHSKPQRLVFDDTLIEDTVQTVVKAVSTSVKDILVFVPGLAEMRKLQSRLGAKNFSLPIEILHSSISLEDQSRILRPAMNRRLILATNIAESSLTLPNVDTVIDLGLEKKSVVEPKIGFERLITKRISLFSAQQRAGRAARTGPGRCFQMWHETDERSMPLAIEPEIIKSNLLEETLVLLKLGYEKPESLSWLTPPKNSFREALEYLKQAELILSNGGLTAKGAAISNCPLDVKSATVLYDLVQKGFLDEACRFFSFVESADFQNLSEVPNFDQVLSWTFRNDLGRRSQEQFKSWALNIKKVNQVSVATKADFRLALIQSYAKYFSERLAQRKDKATALSSRGRGVELSPVLARFDADYFILLHGREVSDSNSYCDFAVPMTSQDFLSFVANEAQVISRYDVNFEQKKIYEIKAKAIGLFKLGEDVRTPVSLAVEAEVFEKLWSEKGKELLLAHEDFKNFVAKLQFILKIKNNPDWNLELESLNHYLLELVKFNFSSEFKRLIDYLNFPLADSVLQLLPSSLKSIYQKLPTFFVSPNGKQVLIDYTHHNAPLISIRLQDVLGLLKHPMVLDTVPLTFELLAPNMRPTQITKDLVGFWKTSYFDVRKDLRARYPKHDWPENPMDWRPEMSKRLKKLT